MVVLVINGGGLTNLEEFGFGNVPYVLAGSVLNLCQNEFGKLNHANLVGFVR